MHIESETHKSHHTTISHEKKPSPHDPSPAHEQSAEPLLSPRQDPPVFSIARSYFHSTREFQSCSPQQPHLSEAAGATLSTLEVSAPPHHTRDPSPARVQDRGSSALLYTSTMRPDAAELHSSRPEQLNRWVFLSATTMRDQWAGEVLRGR